MLAEKKASIRSRTAALAERKARLAADNATADAVDEEPRCFSNSLQKWQRSAGCIGCHGGFCLYESGDSSRGDSSVVRSQQQGWSRSQQQRWPQRQH